MGLKAFLLCKKLYRKYTKKRWDANQGRYPRLKSWLLSLPASPDALWTNCHSPTGKPLELCSSGYFGFTSIRKARCRKVRPEGYPKRNGGAALNLQEAVAAAISCRWISVYPQSFFLYTSSAKKATSYQPDKARHFLENCTWTWTKALPS